MAFISLNPLFSLLEALTFSVIHGEFKREKQTTGPETVALTTLDSAQIPPSNQIDEPVPSIQVENKNALPLATDAITPEQASEIEAQRTQEVPKEDTGAQSSRAFGYIRLGGTTGNFLAALVIALGTLLFASDVSIFILYIVMAFIYDVCCVLTAVSFFFFHTEKLPKSNSLLPHLGTFASYAIQFLLGHSYLYYRVRDRCTLLN